MIACASFQKHYDVNVRVAPLGGVLLVKMKADRPKDVAALEQPAEHLPSAMIRAALQWAEHRDQATTEDLRMVLEAARSRKAPVRKIIRKSKK